AQALHAALDGHDAHGLAPERFSGEPLRRALGPARLLRGRRQPLSDSDWRESPDYDHGARHAYRPAHAPGARGGLNARSATLQRSAVRPNKARPLRDSWSRANK